MSIPIVNLDDLINSINTAIEEENSELGIIHVVEFSNNKLNVIIEDGKPKIAENNFDKIKSFLSVLLLTQLDKYNVYLTEKFGLTYFKYIGQKFLPEGFINSEFKRELEEWVLKLNIVDSLTDFSFIRYQAVLQINFTVVLKDSSTETFSFNL